MPYGQNLHLEQAETPGTELNKFKDIRRNGLQIEKKHEANLRGFSEKVKKLLASKKQLDQGVMLKVINIMLLSLNRSHAFMYRRAYIHAAAEILGLNPIQLPDS